MSIFNETHRLSRYQTFAKLYSVKNIDLLMQLYDVDELMKLMPLNPSIKQKRAFNDLLGVRGASGYLDYQKSNNTFEIVTRWLEKTSDHVCRSGAKSYKSANKRGRFARRR